MGELPIQHPGQANRIYRGMWRNQSVACRIPRPHDPASQPFYDGVNRLFGPSLQSPENYRLTHEWLSRHAPLRVPKLLDIAETADGMAILHEWIAGTASIQFADLSPDGATQFGVYLATLHQASPEGFGSWHERRPASTFWETAVRTISALSDLYMYDAKTLQALRQAAPPEGAASIPQMGVTMVDLHPSQFFIERGRFTHVIDLDFFVLAPPEMELVALERMVNARTAEAIRAGYETIRPFPHLEKVRPFYRALNRALWIHGDEDVTTWRNAPIVF